MCNCKLMFSLSLLNFSENVGNSMIEMFEMCLIYFQLVAQMQANNFKNISLEAFKNRGPLTTSKISKFVKSKFGQSFCLNVQIYAQ